MLDGNCSEMPIAGLMGVVTHMVRQKAMKMFEPYDLKPWQAGILFVLNKEGEMSQKELAKRQNLTPSAITVSIRKMEQGGYIVRKPDPQDQRIMRLSATDKGKAYMENISAAGRQMEEILLHGFSKVEQEQFKAYLLRIHDNLKN